MTLGDSVLARAGRARSGKFGLLSSISLPFFAVSVLVCGLPAPALALTYDVANQTEFQNIINLINTNNDPNPVIQLTGNVTSTGYIVTTSSPLTINTGTFTLTGAEFVKGQPVIISGNGSIGGQGALFPQLYINGASVTNQVTVALPAGSAATGANLLNTATLTNSGTITGGTGAAGGGQGAQVGNISTLINTAAGIIRGGDSTGGAGGIGVGIGVPFGANATLTNQGLIAGGAGTTVGGVGVLVRTNNVNAITNSGMIEGGTGAAAIAANNAAINLNIVNSGTISAGTGANAIQLTAGSTGHINLELDPGSVINGNVVAGAGSADVLTLGGSGSGAFNVAAIGPQYQNFDSFQKTGTSTWFLTGTGTAITNWTVTGGTLLLGNGTTSGSINGNVVTAAGGVFGFDNPGTATYGGVISGVGAVQQIGPGTTILTGTNTYTGGTTISAGTLQLGDGTTNGSIVGNVTNNANLAFDPANGTTMNEAGTISGTGAVQQIGTGALIVTSNNTYSGGTTIAAGTLQLGTGGTTGSIVGNVANNGTLVFDRSDTYGFGGVISGTGAVQQIGAGTTVLTASNTYTGGTTISAGTLQLGDGTTNGSIVGNVTNNANLAFDPASGTTVNETATISGTGTVQQIGTGTTVLSAANSYTGATTVSAGTLQAGAVGAFSSGSNFTVASGGTLDANGISQTVASLTNAGIVATNLHGISTGTNLTVTGNYSGNNGQLVLNTQLNAGGALSNQFTDRLLVKGDPIGNTSVLVRATGGGAFTGTLGPTGIPNAVDGISLVQVAGASTANAFTLPGGYVSGGTPYQYKLYAYGPGSANGPAAASQNLVGNAGSYWDYRLQNANVSPAGPVGASPSGGAPTIPPSARPQLVPQAPAYISAPTALFYSDFQNLDELHRRLGEIRDAQQQGSQQEGEVFVRGFGNTFDYKSTKSFGDYGFNFSGDYSAVQLGGNWIGLDNPNGKLRAGFATTFGSLSYKPSAIDGQSKGDANSVNLAGMLTWQSRLGWYVDAIVSGGWFDGKVTTPQRGKTTSLNGNSLGLSLEAGYPLQTGLYDLIVEPEAQVTYQRLDFAHKTDINAINVDLGSPDQAMFRAGARLLRRFAGPGEMQLTPYFEVNLLQDVGGSNKVSLSNVGFSTGAFGTAVEFRAGVTGALTHNVSLYGDVAREQNVSSGGFRGWAFNGGLRYAF